MKRAVSTVSIGEAYNSIEKITHPSLSAYAKRLSADFVVLREQKTKYPHYVKLEIGKLLDEYERVLFLDTDTIVSKSCPSLFEMVPEDCLGIYDEGKLANEVQRATHYEVMRLAEEFYGISAEPLGYGFYNTGVMVLSQCHKELFSVPPRDEMFANYWDQAYLNLRIRQEKTKIYDIGFKFNRMYYVDPVVNEHRLASHIVHYAGIQTLGNLITTDLAMWAAYQPETSSNETDGNQRKDG